MQKRSTTMNNVTENTKVIYVGIDVHKDTNSFCAYDSREDKLFAEHKSSSKFENTLHYLKNLQKSVGKDAVFLIGYEAGPTGYGLCRKLQKEGFACVIIAPSTIAKAPGQKVRTAKITMLKKAKQNLLSFLLRMGLPYPQSGHYWTQAHMAWLRTVNFADKWLQESFEEYHAEVITLMDKVQRIEAKILELCKDDEVREKIDALVCISGISYVWSYFDCRGNRGFFPFFKGEVLRKLYRTLSRRGFKRKQGTAHGDYESWEFKSQKSSC